MGKATGRPAQKAPRTAAHAPTSGARPAAPKQVRSMGAGSMQPRQVRTGPSPVEQVIQAAGSTTAHIDVKSIAASQLAKDQRVEVRQFGKAARRAQAPRSTGDASAVVATDVKNVAMSQMARGQRKEVTAKGKAARSTSSPATQKPSGRMQMMQGDELAEARQVAAGTKSRAVRKMAAKAAIATKDTMTGLKQLQGFGNKAMYGLAVATPAMFATSAVTHGIMGWNQSKAQGGSNLEAAGSAIKGATPATVALAAPTLIGRAAPKLAAMVSKAALPLTAVAALIGAGTGAYKAAKGGASWGGIAGGAALGMADTFTGGLATTAWTKWAGSGSGDATTLAINQHAAAGGAMKAPSSGASVAGSTPPKLTADTAKRFNAAERTYRQAQEESGGQQREAAAPPESSGRQPGFGPEAIIASYYKRNPGGQNAPYGGDPSAAEGYKPPAAPKDKGS